MGIATTSMEEWLNSTNAAEGTVTRKAGNGTHHSSPTESDLVMPYLIAK